MTTIITASRRGPSLFGLSQSGKGLIGIDITSATVKLLELRPGRQHFRVDSYAVRPLAEGAVVERRIRRMEDVVEAIKRAVDHAQPHSRRVAVAVPASAAITKTLTLPASLSDDEIEARIQLESDKHIPFPFNEVAFDFQRLGLNERFGDQQDVLLVACRQQDVGQLTEAVMQAGLEPAAVDVETFAMERAFGELRHQLPAVDEEPAVALVDIGANMNAFHVLRGDRIIFSRDTVFGGRQLTEAIRGRYGLSFEEAGLAKKRGGLPEDYQGEVLTPFIETLIQQIGRSLQLYYTAGRHPAVSRLILAGGSSVIPGLRERLAEDSGLTIEVANPFARMAIHSRIDIQALASDAPAMLTACGLAMRAGT
ncbi:type IV pilus assembly protein PilM [Modicisalibacter tunisiensis]|uniref:type IV pilus assembly protein PilM n=1 Tax=Modicisalibacter tunisiensis TaxID=390637 RepID=UPI001CCB34E8|nr:type IV pilus assembly protein PilM [Modicisalibacter tunisiensis]MBZ9540163.1 type IV pilus assembly protein PilM [Modicisalibacter tunisiensis]